MLHTHLDAWRTSLLLQLGLTAAACGGAAEDPLAERLHCVNDGPSQQGSDLRQCENEIVHRPAGGALGTHDLCASDADCGEGLLCIATDQLIGTAADGCYEYDAELLAFVFACQTPGDTCASSSHCKDHDTCVLTGGRHLCRALSGCPVPGRPFLVGDAARVAGVVASLAWCEAPLLPVIELPEVCRERILAHWRAAALLEHASIAAFARFALQLLALGAPPELLLACQEAMRDETEHARRCFALASRYAGVPLGPTTLCLEGALAELSLASVVQLTFREGCLGESVAALEAAEALAVASDPEVRRTLEIIVRDERRHAELAFRFVAWALQQPAGSDLHGLLRAELERARAELEAPRAPLPRERDSALAGVLCAHGVPDAARHAELRRAAFHSVVEPCTEALLRAHSPTHERPSHPLVPG